MTVKARIAAIAVALVACGTTATSAQTLTGRVLEAGSDRAVAAAAVAVTSGGRTILGADTDSAGVFRIRLPQAGWYALRVERLGYAAAATDSIAVGIGEVVEITLRLSVTAVPLAPVLVVERRVPGIGNPNAISVLSEGRHG